MRAAGRHLAGCGRHARGWFVARLALWGALLGGLGFAFVLGGSALARPTAPAAPTAAGPVEQPQLRTATSTTFKLPDGSYQTVVNSLPVHYELPGGVWKDIDTALVPSSARGFALETAANGFQVRFGSTADAQPLLSLTVGKAALALGVTGASSSSQAVGAGDTVTYPDAFPNVDLAFQSLPNGVETSLILQKRPAGPVSFRFPLSLSGLNPTVLADGSVQLARLGASARLKSLVISRAAMTDASGVQAPVSENAPLALDTTGGRLVLVLTPDLSWLQDPSRVYPVTIDPTTTVNTNTATYVRSDLSNPVGNVSQLQVGSSNGGSTIARTLVNWDLSTLAGMQVTSASLVAWESNSASCTASPVSIYLVTSSWSASSVTWATQPTINSTALSTVSAAKGYSGSCPAGNVSFGDLTSTVQAWLSGTQPEYGIETKAGNESDSNGWKMFASGYPLTINYTTAPMVPTNLAPSDGTVSGSTTPTLSGTFNHGNPSATGHLDFEVYRSSDNLLMASGSGNTVTAGQTSSWHVPSGQLPPGTAYYWHARSNDGTQTSVWSPIVHYTANNTPPTPTLVSPASGASLPTLTPTLNATSVDPDGNPVSLKFQVASNSTFTNIIGTSDWLPTTTTFEVPDGWLTDAHTYYWRAEAQDSLGATSAWSAGANFTANLPMLGTYDYWPIWSHGPLSVNEASGNLTDVLPGPSYPTQNGQLSLDPAYNLLDQTDHGLGPGWVLGVGPDGAPLKLIDRSQFSGGKFDAAELVWADGSSSIYAHVGATSVYLPPSGKNGKVSKNPDGTWTFVGADGTIDNFNTTGSNGVATLKSVESAGTAAGQARLSFTFASSDSNKLTSVTDIDSGRTLTLTWNSLNPSGCPNALLCVSGPDGVTWKYVGDGNGRLFKVNDGTRDLYAVSYDTSNRITKVQNANDLDPAHASPGYNGNHAVTITYTGDGKVATVNDGPITNQTPATSTWSFAYHPGSVSTTATRADHIGMPAGTVRTAAGYTTVTPPNQQGQQSPKSVKTYYDDQNRPIEVDDILGHVREWAYNNHNEVQWLEDADGNPVDNVWDTVNNVLLSTTGPDPDGAGPLSRPTITYRYDETQIGTASTASAALTGFRGDYYANINLSGRPAATETDSNVDFYWGTGAPSALPGVTSNYSVRWSGEIKIGNVGDYTFNTSADDGTRLTIDGISAIDNWKDQSITQVTSQPIHLDNGLHKFVLEYYHKTGTSRIGLSWNCNNCDPNGANPIFLPAYNTPTSAVSPTGRIAFTHYASPWTGNPDYTLQKDDSGANVITSYSYDSYGRVTQKVMPKGNASRTIDANGNLQGSPDTTYATAYTYYAPTDTAAPPAACGGGSAVNQTGQLASKTPHGVASTSYVYDAAGNTIATTRAVGTICDTYTGENREATTTAPGDAQATTYAYDPTGALRTATDGSGTITREYDEAGDLKRTVDSFGGEEKFTFDAESNATSRVAAVGSLGSNPNYVTNYTYNDAGQLTQLTDPAGRVYKFFYDTRGNLKATQYPTPPLAGMTSTPTVGSWVSTTATARFQSHFRPRCRQTRSGARSPITPTPTALMARRVKKSGREAG